MSDPDPGVPRWQKALAGLLAVALTAWIIIDRARFKADLLPLDNSRVGPNLAAAVIQWAVIVIVAALIWPPARRRIHKFADGTIAGVHARIDGHHARQDAHNQWAARTLHRIHLEQIGEPPEPHPHFDTKEPPT